MDGSVDEGFCGRLIRFVRLTLRGAVAQLGEHLLCKQGVSGSIPLSSTKGLVLKLCVFLVFVEEKRFAPWRYAFVPVLLKL